jgi:hypothetical protein
MCEALVGMAWDKLVQRAMNGAHIEFGWDGKGESLNTEKGGENWRATETFVRRVELCVWWAGERRRNLKRLWRLEKAGEFAAEGVEFGLELRRDFDALPLPDEVGAAFLLDFHAQVARDEV